MANYKYDWNTYTITEPNGTIIRFNNANDMVAYTQKNIPTIQPNNTITTPNINTNTQITSNITNLPDIFKQLQLNPTNGQSINTVHLGDQTLYHFGSNLDSKAEDLLKKNGIKIFKSADGKSMYGIKDDTFMQKYGSTIQTGLAAGGLALGIANYLDSHDIYKKQSALIDEQTNALRSNREHLQQEWDRINRIRKKLNSSY